jgi:hypothetical protein
MTQDIDKEHTIETYKSMIQISLEGFRLLAILNGGAAVALLSYLGSTAARGTSPSPDLRGPMGCYLLGLLLCGVTMFFSYRTQFILHNENMGIVKRGQHMVPQRVAVWLAVASLAMFGLGSWAALSALRPN